MVHHQLLGWVSNVFDPIVRSDEAAKGIDVVAVGNATTDYVLAFSAPLQPGRKLVANSMMMVAGGEAVNAGITMAALGLRVNFVGRFGSDEAGRGQVKALTDAGCLLEGSVVIENAAHHFAAVLVSGDGERSIITSKPDELVPSVDQLTPSLMQRTRAFFSDGREPVITAHGAQLAKSSGVRVFLDAEAPELLADVLLHVDELIVPAHVITEFSGYSDVDVAMEMAAQLGPSVVIVTMGEGGSIACSSVGEQWFQAAQPTNVVDTTGAGDGFHAGYIAGRLRGLSVPDSMSLGSKIAATVCAHSGPRAPRQSLLECDVQ